MPRHPWTRLAPIVWPLMIAACASPRPPSPVALPRLDIPPVATEPCRIEILPPRPTIVDLETAYMARGESLIACDGARRLLLDGWRAERALQDRRRPVRSR